MLEMFTMDALAGACDGRIASSSFQATLEGSVATLLRNRSIPFRILRGNDINVRWNFDVTRLFEPAPLLQTAVITLPALALSRLNSFQVSALIGAAYHEAAHLLYTNASGELAALHALLDKYPKAAELLKAHPDWVFSICNLIEDIYIEHLLVAEFPHTKRRLADLRALTTRYVHSQPPAQADLLNDALFYAQTQVLGYKLPDDEAFWSDRAALYGDAWSAVQDLVASLPLQDWSPHTARDLCPHHPAFEATLRVVEVLDPSILCVRGPDDSSDRESDGNSGNASGEEDDDKQNNRSGGSGDDNVSGDGRDGRDDRDGGDGRDHPSSGGQTTTPETCPSEAPTQAQGVTKHPLTMDTTRAEALAPLIEAATAEEMENAVLATGSEIDTAELLRQARRQAAPITAALRVKMKVRRLVPSTQGQAKGRKLSSRHLVDTVASVRAFEPPKTAFAALTKDFIVDFTCAIFIDCSSSMDTTMLRYAMEGALALSHAVEQCGGKSIIAGFDSVYTPLRTHGRFQIVKNTKTSTRAAAPVVAALRASGGTPTHLAAELGVKILAHRREDRHRLMFILTDGFPNDEQRLNDALLEASELGVTSVIIGIGPQADGIEKRIAHGRVVHCDPSHLGSELAHLLHSTLS